MLQIVSNLWQICGLLHALSFLLPIKIAAMLQIVSNLWQICDLLRTLSFLLPIKIAAMLQIVSNLWQICGFTLCTLISSANKNRRYAPNCQ
jgi:predicted membrane protein